MEAAVLKSTERNGTDEGHGAARNDAAEIGGAMARATLQSSWIRAALCSLKRAGGRRLRCVNAKTGECNATAVDGAVVEGMA